MPHTGAFRKLFCIGFPNRTSKVERWSQAKSISKPRAWPWWTGCLCLRWRWLWWAGLLFYVGKYWRTSRCSYCLVKWPRVTGITWLWSEREWNSGAEIRKALQRLKVFNDNWLTGSVHLWNKSKWKRAAGLFLRSAGVVIAHCRLHSARTKMFTLISHATCIVCTTRHHSAFEAAVISIKSMMNTWAVIELNIDLSQWSAATMLCYRQHLHNDFCLHARLNKSWSRQCQNENISSFSTGYFIRNRYKLRSLNMIYFDRMIQGFVLTGTILLAAIHV